MIKRLNLSTLVLILLLGFIGLIPQTNIAYAQGPTPVPTITSNRCSSYLFPYGDWQISSGSTINNGDGYVYSNEGINNIFATLTLNNTYSLYSISVSWNPGTAIISQFGTLSADTSIQNANSDGQTQEHRQAVYNQNEADGTTFYFIKPANTILISLSKESPILPMYMKVTAICASDGGPNPPIPPNPSSTPTSPPTATSGGPTLTTTPVPNTPTHTHTPTPSNTPRPTVTPGPGSATAGPSPTLSGSATATPEGGVAPGPISGGSFSTIPPPSQCGDALNPCGANPFMPNGVAAYSTPVLNTVVPITPVPGQPTSTLIFGPYCPTAVSGPTNTPCPTQTPDLSQTPNDAEGAIVAFATNMYAQNQAILTTPGFVGPDGSTLIDLSNSGNQIGSYLTDFFGLIRAVTSFFLGKTGNIVAILLLILGFTLVVDFLLFVIPVVIAIFKLFLQIATAVFGLIP